MQEPKDYYKVQLLRKFQANLFSLGLPLWEGADYHAQYDNDLFANFTSIEFESNSNCTTIGANAFAGCKITELTLPNSVTTAGDFAFSGCKQLTYLYASGLTTIGIDTFYNCPLENILVTSSVIKTMQFPKDTLEVVSITGTGDLTDWQIPEGNKITSSSNIDNVLAFFSTVRA